MIFQNCPKYHEPRSGEWYLENFEILRAGIIAKYQVQVMLLFVYNRSQEIFGNTQETSISLRLKKQRQASAFVQSFYVSEKVIDSILLNQLKPLNANNMK